MELNAASVLVALAATVLAGQGAPGRAARGALVTSFAIGALLFATVGLPPVDALAFCVGAWMVAVLARPRSQMLPPVGAGLLAASWASILAVRGLPWLPAAFAAALLVLVALVLAARRRDFVSADVRDEALVLVGSFALLLAVGPAVADGWRTGAALAAEPLGASVPEVGPWVGVLAAGSLLLGGVYAAWKRR